MLYQKPENAEISVVRWKLECVEADRTNYYGDPTKKKMITF